MADDVDFPALARRTAGFTGADLGSVVNESALLAIRESSDRIRASHLMEAVERVRHGPQRRGKLLNAEERERIAVHECGHVLVAAALGRGGQVTRVSVVARGRGLGQTTFSDELAERALLTAGELEAQLATAMSGVAAEQLLLGERSTTAEDDLRQASSLAREMVGLYGMSSEVGGLSILARRDEHLGSELGVIDTVSGQTMAEFDQAVKRLVAAGQSVATDLLTIHRVHLEAMVDRLQEDETMEGAVLEQFLSAVRPHPAADGSRRRRAMPEAAAAKRPPRTRTTTRTG